MATWHQLRRPVKLTHATDWAVVSDPPNGMRSVMLFKNKSDAEAFAAKDRHAFILQPDYMYKKNPRMTHVRRNPSRESEPAVIIEGIIDQTSLAKVCDMLAGICGEKADHIATNWQDNALANKWQRASNNLITLAQKFRRAGL